MILEIIQQQIENVGTSLPPDADWMPHMILEDADDPITGPGSLILMGILSNFDWTKEGFERGFVAQIIRDAILRFRPKTACFFATGYTKFFDLALPPFKPVHMYTNKQEAVIGIVAGNEGAVEIVGEIQRHPDHHPVITRWNTINNPTGFFVRVMCEGFRQLNQRNN